MTNMSIAAAVLCAASLAAFAVSMKRLERMCEVDAGEAALAWPITRTFLLLLVVLMSGSAV